MSVPVNSYVRITEKRIDAKINTLVEIFPTLP